MFVKTTDLNDLFALPASRQHRALLPVVDIDRLLVEIFVVLAAEVARLLIDLFRTVVSGGLGMARSRTLTILVRIHLLLGHIILRVLVHSCSPLSA